MSLISERAFTRNRLQAAQASRADPGTPKARHYCRNPRCRMKLPAPVENEHHAFCCWGCHSSFYRSRCLVCEEPIRRKSERQRFGSGHKTCEREYRHFPRVYDFVGPAGYPTSAFADESPAEAHSTGLKIGVEAERPRRRALPRWSWHSGGIELELRDADGTLLARIESNAGRYRLTCPRTWPVFSWPILAEAKHRAESLALAATPSNLSARHAPPARGPAKISTLTRTESR